MNISLSDAKDYFHACELPPGLGNFSCLPDIAGDEVKSMTGGDPAINDLWKLSSVAPAMKVMPMGWAWSFFFAQIQRAHQVGMLMGLLRGGGDAGPRAAASVPSGL